MNGPLVRPLLDGRVIVVSKENDKENELLVKMHAGLWATCYDLTGKQYIIYHNGFELFTEEYSSVYVLFFKEYTLALVFSRHIS